MTGGERGAVALTTSLGGLVLTVAAIAVIVAVTDLSVAAARARTAADAAALAAAAASPLAGGDGRPVRAAAPVATANGARLVATSADDGAAVAPGGWPLRVEVAVTVTPSTALVRAAVPTLRARAAAAVRPPEGGVGLGLWSDGSAGGQLLGDGDNLTLTGVAADDLAAGVVDQRVVALLRSLAARHRIAVSVLRTGHSKYVAGTDRISNHYLGCAVDVYQVDGVGVGVGNAAARALVAWLASLSGPLAPSEVGSPFAEFAHLPGFFTDGAHTGHVHIGYRC